jgi:glutamate-1-semialdehyde 2,1-aminomutase
LRSSWLSRSYSGSPIGPAEWTIRKMFRRVGHGRCPFRWLLSTDNGSPTPAYRLLDLYFAGDKRGGQVDQARIEAVAAVEERRFRDDRPASLTATSRAAGTMPRGVPVSWMDELYDHPPVWVSHGAGSRFWDLDGHEYVDMYVADMSAFCGHAPAPVVRAVCERVAAGSQFLLPSEDALVVAEELAQRYGMAKWQFTLSASQANAEVVRIARVRTGREKVVVFDGKYHGHLEPTLAVLEDGRILPEYTGLPAAVTANLRIVPFNDLDAVQRALAPGDVALLMAEPAMTNAGFLLPDPGFHDGLRELTRRHGTLLAIDETHTLVTAYGGLTTEWGLEPDLLTVGKSIAGGVPLGAYGMTDDVAAVLRPPAGGAAVSGIAYDEVATGGTLFANALSMAAARAALTEVLTREAFIATARLGETLAAGLRAHIRQAGLPWSVNAHGSHAYYFFSPQPPREARGARDADDPGLRALIRLFLANRGLWESGWWLGPTVSVAHTPQDVQSYLDTIGELIQAVT